MCEYDWINELSDSLNKSKDAKNKSDQAQKLLAEFLKKKNTKNLDKVFELILESNTLEPKGLDSYLALSCMYYIKNKKEISLGILYKAKEYHNNDKHLNTLISDIENELIEILIKKEKNNKSNKNNM